MAIVKEFFDDHDVPEEIRRLIKAEIKEEDKGIEIPEGTEDAEAYVQSIEDGLRETYVEKRTSFFNTKLQPEIEKQAQEKYDAKAKGLFPATVNPLIETAVQSGFITAERAKELRDSKDHKGIFTESFANANKAVVDGQSEDDSDKKDLLTSLNDSKSKTVELQGIIANKDLEIAELKKTSEAEKIQGINEFKEDKLINEEIDSVLDELNLNAKAAKKLIPGTLAEYGYKYQMNDKGNHLDLKDLKGANALSIDKKREIFKVSEGIREICEAEGWIKISHTEDELGADGQPKPRLANKSNAVNKYFPK